MKIEIIKIDISEWEDIKLHKVQNTDYDLAYQTIVKGVIDPMKKVVLTEGEVDKYLLIRDSKTEKLTIQTII